jgi:hypothetical protein
MSEAWRDDNENRTYDAGEKFIDFNNNQKHDARDTLFNGPQCQGTKCGADIYQSIHVRKAIVLAMSSSQARLTLASSSLQGVSNLGLPYLNKSQVYATNDSLATVDGAAIDLPEDQGLSFDLYFADTGSPFGQTLPMDTVINVSADSGELAGTTTMTVGNTQGTSDPNAYGGNRITFTFKNTNTVANVGDVTLVGQITMKATTPKNIVTTLTIPYILRGN